MRTLVWGLAWMVLVTGTLACGDEESAVDPCHGVTCSDFGSCVEQDGRATCQCTEGYRPEGLDCVEDICTGIPWVPNEDAGDAAPSDGALHLSATGTERPTITYSITGNFDATFLVEGLTADAEVDYAATGGNRSVVAAIQPDLAIAGWINQISPSESESDFINHGGTGNSGQLRIQRSGNNFTATATVGTGQAAHTYNIQTTTVAISLWLESSTGEPVSASVTEFQVASGSLQTDPFDCDNFQRE